MNHLIKRGQLRRAASKTLSVTLSATTTVWLVGSSLFMGVPSALASNDAVVSDITSTNPRIAPLGESELAVLGINIVMDANDGTHSKALQSFVVQLKSDDGAGNGEAALSNIETARFYSDSGLSGTGGVFDSNDALIDAVSRASATDADADGDTVNTTLIAQTALAAVFADSFGHGIAAPTTTICLDDAAAAGLAVGDAITFLDASAALAFNRIVTVVTDITNATAAANACVAAAGAVATHTLITVDSAMAGVAEAAADSTDTVTEVANYPAGITALQLTSEADADADDFVKVGAGLTAEILTLEASPVGTIWTIDGIPGGGLTGTVFAHANLDAVVEVADQVPLADSINEGFSDFADATLHAGYEMGIAWGDTLGDDDPDVLAYTPPSVDTGNDAGNDMFITFLTRGGVADQTFAAAIWGDALTGLKLNDTTANTRNMAVGSNTTGNESKTITFGSDNVAPTIQNVWTYDNDGDGNVDRARVKFSESMAAVVTLTDDFASAIGGNANNIESTPASVDEIDLLANGTWQTTTVLNDTFQIDFAGDGQSADCTAEVVGTYCNATASTGDTWTVVYDFTAGGANDLTDATGTVLADQTITTTDKARPVILAASDVRDTEGDSQVDQLRVVLSEAMAGTSTSSGLVLRNTTNVPSTTYTLGAVSGLSTSTGAVAAAGNAATANANDTVSVAVTESGGNDVANVFTLDYTAASTLSDTAANEARSVTGFALVTGSVPFVISAYFVDLDDVAAGVAAIAADNDADGQLDGLFVTFNQNVDVDNGAVPSIDMTLSGGYAFAAVAPLTEDDNTVLVFPITQSGVVDTNNIPDWTYTDDGAADGSAICALGDADNDCADSVSLLGSIVSSTVVEQELAGPRIISASLYETTADDIWQSGETMTLVFSEPLDPSSMRTSWTLDSLLVGPSDFAWGTVTAAEMPDNGTISVSGRTVTFTATVSANVALAAADTIQAQTNEIVDMHGNTSSNTVADTSTQLGNAADPMNDQVAATLLTVTPAVAPLVLRVQNNDANGDGRLDSFIVEFGGLLNASTIVATDFTAARGSNFNVNSLGLAVAACAGAIGDYRACSNSNVTPDLTIASVTTVNGGTDSRLLVSYTEVGENTGSYPQLKYVQGTLADPSGNKIATFNVAPADNMKFDVLIGDGAAEFATRDLVLPLTVHKLLKDRDLDGKIDQLVLVFSETILNGAGTVVNAALSTSGWAVAGKTLAANGLTSNNLSYTQYTFATVNNVFSFDVTEGTAVDTSAPAVTYVSSGQVRDTGGNLLGNVLGGGEATDITVVAPPSTMADGALFQGTGAEVWIAKHVGSQMFRRHVLFSNFDTFYPHLAPFWSNVEMVSDATVTAHSLSAWVRVVGTAPVYEINDDNTKHWITCADDSVVGQDCANEWSMSGRNSAGIYDVNTAEFNSYVTGATVIMPDQVN